MREIASVSDVGEMHLEWTGDLGEQSVPVCFGFSIHVGLGTGFFG